MEQRLNCPSEDAYWWWLPEAYEGKSDSRYWSIVHAGPDTDLAGEFVGPLNAPSNTAENTIYMKGSHEGWIINLLGDGIEVISPAIGEMEVRQTRRNAVIILEKANKDVQRDSLNEQED